MANAYRHIMATGVLMCFVYAMPAIGIKKDTVNGATKITTLEAQEYSIIARSFEYLPRRVVLRKNVPARIYFTSIDRAHDVKINKLNIREKVVKGKVTIINLITEEVGTYEYACDIYCGPGHRGMKGEIVVVNGE